MHTMSDAEWREFVGHGTRTGVLATVRPDGRPHTVPVWFLLDGDDVVFTTWHTSVQAGNLRHDPRAALCVQDEALPYSFVTIEGTVRIGDDPGQLREWATRIATRYVGPELGGQYGARNGVEGELLVRLTPTRVVAHAAIAEPADRS
jgi:PPOX class probable F420-dependent enzyme